MSSTETYTEEQWIAKQAAEVKSKTDGLISLMPGKRHAFTRVSVLCAEPGCETYATGHEIIKLKVGDNFDQVGALIKARFLKVQNGDSKVRANVRHCLWTADDHKIDSIKVNWNGGQNSGWNDNCETILTQLNCQDILVMMADRAAVDTMTVTISAKE